MKKIFLASLIGVMVFTSLLAFTSNEATAANEIPYGTNATPGGTKYFIWDIKCDSSGGELIYPDSVNGGKITKENRCDFNELIELINRLIDFMFYMSTILAAICFVIAGFLLLTGGGNASKVTQAKAIFTNVLLGYIIILSAWLIVGFVTQTFMLKKDYSIIEPVANTTNNSN